MLKECWRRRLTVNRRCAYAASLSAFRLSERYATNAIILLSYLFFPSLSHSHALHTIQMYCSAGPKSRSTLFFLGCIPVATPSHVLARRPRKPANQNSSTHSRLSPHHTILRFTPPQPPPPLFHHHHNPTGTGLCSQRRK